MLTGIVLLPLGVLSTAGEWSHRTAQTTLLLVPHRGRVLMAKAIGVAILATALAAVAVLSAAELSDMPARVHLPRHTGFGVAAGHADGVRV